MTTRISPLDGIGVPHKSGNAQACLAHAKLDFEVETVDLHTLADGMPPEKYFVTRRTDTREVLGVVEGRYKVFQNRQVFAVADDLVQHSGAIIQRASSLEGGARCFLSLEWPKDKAISVVGDLVSRRAIMQNAHNGKFAAMIRLMPLRLACVNGMMVPVPQFSFEFKIHHTASGDDRLAEAQQIMKRAGQYFETFGQVANRMAHTKLSKAHASLLLKQVPGLEKTTTACESKRDEILRLFGGEQVNGNHEAVKGTAWGLLNAVTEYADFGGRIRRTRGNEASAQRFKAALEGAGARLKLATYDVMMRDGELGLGELVRELAKRN